MLLACPEITEKFLHRGGFCSTIPAEPGRQWPIRCDWKLEFIQSENSATSLAQYKIRLKGLS